jgi:c-di-GMP-binding flagellar brake protein YcgR
VGEEEPQYIKPQIERRQHRRAKLVTQVRCEALGREELLVTRDISIGGLFLHSSKPLPRDSEITLSFRLQAEQPAVTCRGKVVNSIPGLGMGIQFLDVDEATQRALEKFVDESL